METTTTTEGAEAPKKPRGEKMRRFGQNLAEFAKQSPGWIASFFSVFLNFMMTLFTWVAGCDLAVIGTMPTGEINKKAAIGLTMLFTIAVAAFAAGNAGAIFLSPGLVIPFAILWAGVIFSIDRAIIVFMDTKQAHAAANGNGTSNWSKWSAIGGRFVIIFCMSYLTSTAVEMLIFEKEIEGVISEKRDKQSEKVRNESDSLRNVLSAEKATINETLSGKRGELASYASTLDAEINALRQNIQAEQDTLRLEIQGRVGSGKQGAGPAAEAIRANISADEAELAELIAKRGALIAGSVAQSEVKANEEFADNRFKELDERRKIIDEDETRKLAEVTTVVGDGFKDRYLALQRLWSDTPFLMFMVFLLLMIIESMPILLKLFSGIGRYEEGLAQQYAQHKADKMNAVAMKLTENQLTHENGMLAITKKLNEVRQQNTELMTEHARIATQRETELAEAEKARRANASTASLDEFDSELELMDKKLSKAAAFVKKADITLVIDETSNSPESRWTIKAIKERFFDAIKLKATKATEVAEEEA